MNKLMGFYELKDSSLPTINWKRYTGKETLTDEYLWTIRTAVFEGNDLNLPRFVGVRGAEANVNIKHLYEMYKDKGMVIFYPFFVAEKSGTLNVYNDKVVIEAVNKDLWNLVSHFNVDVTIIKDSADNSEKIIGDEKFLSSNEVSEIVASVPEIKKMFRDFLTEGRSVLLEWSFAYNCDRGGFPTGNRYLVFYEARVV